jgi:hypothetical protein
MINGRARVESAGAFVKLTRDVVERMAAARLSLAALRLVLFLIREHLRHGGQENGRLKAPHRQLVAFGISAGLVTSAIEETERAGLLRRRRVGGRRATLFELTWLPRLKHADGDLAPRRKAELLTKAKARLPPQTEADRKNLPPDPEAQLPPDPEADP